MKNSRWSHFGRRDVMLIMTFTASIILAAVTVPRLSSSPRPGEFEMPAGAFAGLAAPGAGVFLVIMILLVSVIAVGRWWLVSRKKTGVRKNSRCYTNAFHTTRSLTEIASIVAMLTEFEWSFDDHLTRDTKLVGVRRSAGAVRIAIQHLSDELFNLRMDSGASNPGAANAYFEVRQTILDLLNARLVISSVDEEISATHDGERDSLYLNGQGVTELPATVAVLSTHLKYLWVSDNLLTRLPIEIGQLTRLIELDASMNCLVELPDSIETLRELENLQLTHNNLAYLPPTIGHLEMLKTLAVDDNRLTMLPPQLGKLRRLSQLFVQNNFLLKLPLELAQLDNLKSEFPPKNEKKLVTPRLRLKVAGNPLIEPPLEVVRKGTDAIKQYLRTRGGSSEPGEPGDPHRGIIFFASMMNVPDSFDSTIALKLSIAFPELAWKHVRHEATGRRCWGSTLEAPQRLVIGLSRKEDMNPFRLIIGVRASEQANPQKFYRSLLDRVTRALEMEQSLANTFSRTSGA